jgi:hypothetical protein
MTACHTHTHRRLARVRYVCPACAYPFAEGDLRLLLPRLPIMACCCPWCGFHGGLLSFARAEEWAA